MGSEMCIRDSQLTKWLVLDMAQICQALHLICVREVDPYMDSVYAGIPRNEAFVTRALSFFIALELGLPLLPSKIAHYPVAPSEQYCCTKV